MTGYLIAKYVDDLSRNEPRNIGVVAYDGARAVARFDGEDETGRLDLRRVRQRITGSRSYRAWVDYWRRALREPAILDSTLRDTAPGDPTVIERLLALPGGDFYLENGGAILHDADAADVSETVDRLFIRLVRQEEPPAPPNLREKTREALADAGAPLDDAARFRERMPVRLRIEDLTVEEEVTYAVMNEDWHYVQAVPFDSSSTARSRKEVSHCVFLFEHVLADTGRKLGRAGV